MVVRLRLARFGKKRQPMYKIFAADARCPRDGRHLEVRPLDPACVGGRGTVAIGLSGARSLAHALTGRPADSPRAHALTRSLSSRRRCLGIMTRFRRRMVRACF